MIKRFVVLLMLWPAFTAHCAPVNEIWDRANTAYVNAEYDKAIAGYDSIFDQGYGGYKLYYNLANAWFKKGEIGKAVLYYNSALKLAPNDADIRYNLEMANAQVQDNIPLIPEIFLIRWVRSVKLLLSSNGWAWSSLVMLICVVVLALLFLFSRRPARRAGGFFGSLAALALLIVCLSFSITRKNELQHPDQAIVMKGSVPVKSSPEHNSTDLFILHEGTKVYIDSHLNGWTEIRIADGNKGWVPAGSIEIIY